jgi:hypothetical protein
MEQREGDELLKAVKEGVSDVSGIVGVLERDLTDCATGLRIEHTETVFRKLAEGIQNLEHLMDFLGQLREGLGHLSRSGFGASSVFPDSASQVQPLFRDMLAAFEAKDWITVADLIQYELKPVLSGIEADLLRVKEELSAGRDA